MKTPAWCLFLLVAVAGPLFASEDAVIAAVRAADDERLAATRAADAARLNAIFSDALHYAHSNGKVENKAAFIQSLTSGQTRYEAFTYQERAFTVAGPNVVLMTGRVLAHVKSGGQPLVLDLSFLAVWRHEDGQWGFLAWQSARIPPPAPAK
jgi:ketosteroid isomerase-like protein